MKTVKIFISLLLFTIITVVSLPVQASYFTTAGDVSGNLKVDSEDARLILQYAVGLIEPSQIKMYKADLNFDGTVNAEDSRLALRTAVGYEPVYKILAQTYYVKDFVTQKQYYQAAKSEYGDKCWGFALIYAKAINTSNNNIIADNINNGNDPKNVSAKQTTGSKATVLNAIAAELKNSKACVVQVNGPNSGRHYVTVVGYKKTADLNNLNETDLLILDVYDGKIKQISSTTRYLFSNYKKYGYNYQMYTVK